MINLEKAKSGYFVKTFSFNGTGYTVGLDPSEQAVILYSLKLGLGVPRDEERRAVIEWLLSRANV